MSGCPVVLIDAGNTYIKWRYTQEGELVKAGKIASAGFSSLFEGGGLDLSGCEVAISSVLDDNKTMSIVYAAKENGAKLVCVAETRKSFLGLRVAYENYRALGVDRWLVMLASYIRYGGGVCVIDAGSAITADFVNYRGEHDGGLILPGFPLLFGSLSISTDKVGEHLLLDGLNFKPGVSTRECVNNGVSLMVMGALKEIAGLVQNFEGELVVLTGGDAVLLHDAMTWSVRSEVNESLIFDGLAIAMANDGLKVIK